ncbi:MAG: sigma-70 family RNA polymerase sigma factor [Schwartzia sp.]|nr:sigma-70 family RNA polymerase sigma factor [Schwartzia sp. (in: firmicutes)]
MFFDEYIRELNRIELLAPEEEARLWTACKEQKDEAARRRLIRSYQPLVFKYAAPYRALDNVMDIIQEGTIGLIEAVESYEPKRGTAFSLFAVHRIRGRMKNFLKKEGMSDIACIDGMTDPDGIPARELIADSGALPEEQAERHALVEELYEAMARLPQKERLVLEGVFLKSGEVGDVAEELHLSASHIYRLQKTGIRRIRGMMSRFIKSWREK